MQATPFFESENEGSMNIADMFEKFWSYFIVHSVFAMSMYFYIMQFLRCPLFHHSNLCSETEFNWPFYLVNFSPHIFSYLIYQIAYTQVLLYYAPFAVILIYFPSTPSINKYQQNY
jgi:hypothetical protein